MLLKYFVYKINKYIFAIVKKIVNQIIAVCMISGILFSVSGMKWHFHYCETSEKLYADLHLINVDCCHNAYLCKDKGNSCFDHQNDKTDYAKEGKKDCCIDVNTVISTDYEYIGKQHKLNIFPAEIILYYTFLSEISSRFISSVKAPEEFVPPDLLSSVILLI